MPEVLWTICAILGVLVLAYLFTRYVAGRGQGGGPSRLGKRMSVFSIENVFAKYQKAAKISQSATPHSLRHSFATQLLNNGAGIRDVQELLGHSSIVTTQIYTEVSIKRKREVLMRYNGRNKLEVE